MRQILPVVTLLLCVLAGGYFFLELRPAPDRPTADALVAQMTAAADGAVSATHVFGGPLSVEKRGQAAVVTVEKIPPKACLTAGWSLAQKGSIAVNGLVAPHLSAAKLVDMCNLSAEGAKITWIPQR